MGEKWHLIVGWRAWIPRNTQSKLHLSDAAHIVTMQNKYLKRQRENRKSWCTFFWMIEFGFGANIWMMLYKMYSSLWDWIQLKCRANQLLRKTEPLLMPDVLILRFFSSNFSTVQQQKMVILKDALFLGRQMNFENPNSSHKKKSF